ncbi:MAG: hypothetical protein GF320_17505, partial [Armatimonadia bacterium]|nr:hypothetical protein [Armatimonadia bacterium]
MRRRLGEILVDAGMIDDGQLKQALEYAAAHRCLLGRALVEMDFATDQQIASALAEQLDMPYIGAGTLTLDETAVERLPFGYAQSRKIIPGQLASGAPVLAMVDPLDVSTLDFVREMTGTRYDPAVIAAGDADHILGTAAGKQDQLNDLVQELGTRDDFQIEDTDPGSEVFGEVAADAAPAVQIVSTVIANGIEFGASDIHIEARVDGVQVRYRIDGKLRDGAVLPSYVQAPIISRVKILADMDISEKRAPQDGHIKARFRDRSVDLRVSTLPTAFGEKAVLRILDKAGGPTSLESIGFDPLALEVMTNALDQPQGMVLVTGPTGSGKSTTLYASLGYLQDETENIVTIEDPVERFISGINQVQILEAAGVTFASVLRSVLRQDPDIVMVGEIRDFETAEIAMRAALTGHLVLSTLHTNDAVGTITRLGDIGVDPYLVASSVILCQAQRLVRTCCQNCLTEYAPHEAIVTRASRMLGYEVTGPFYHGVGCDRCSMTGYAGRLAVYEVMQVTEAQRMLISLEAKEHQIHAQATKDGMLPMFHAGIQRALAGMTTLEEVVHSVPSPRPIDETAAEDALAALPGRTTMQVPQLPAGSEDADEPQPDQAPASTSGDSEPSGEAPPTGGPSRGPIPNLAGVADTGEPGIVVYVPRSLTEEFFGRLHRDPDTDRSSPIVVVPEGDAPTGVAPGSAEGVRVDLDLEALIREVQGTGPPARVRRSERESG